MVEVASAKPQAGDGAGTTFSDAQWRGAATVGGVDRGSGEDRKIAALGLAFRGANAANGEEILKQGDGFLRTHA
jgi:hypothetical protein